MSHAGDMLQLMAEEDQVDRGRVTYHMSRSYWGTQKMICMKTPLPLWLLTGLLGENLYMYSPALQPNGDDDDDDLNFPQFSPISLDFP